MDVAGAAAHEYRGAGIIEDEGLRRFGTYMTQRSTTAAMIR